MRLSCIRLENPNNDPNAVIQSLYHNLPIGTVEGIREEATSRSKNIFSSYNELGQIIVRHEAIIQKRWAKKTRPQRLKILLEAWPGMSAGHRPDYAALHKGSNPKSPRPVDSSMSRKYRDAYIWPHINQEDLAGPRALLLLLNARARNPPQVFAGADYQAMRLGRISQNIMPVFLTGHTMIMHGTNDPQKYGQLISWDDHKDALEWYNTQKQFQPGEGILILEAQERLMKFLLDCCRITLRDILSGGVPADAYPVQPEPYLKTSLEANGYDSLLTMKEESPYRVPSKMDLGRIEAILRARVGAAEDKLWALREDPSYFLEQLIEEKEHTQEMIADRLGKQHLLLHPTQADLFWAGVCSSLVTEAYLELESFTELHRLSQNLARLEAEYADTLSLDKDLPEPFLDAILFFRHHLKHVIRVCRVNFKIQLASSPAWRKFFVRVPPIGEPTSDFAVVSKPGIWMNDIESRLFTSMSLLWEDYHELAVIGLPILLDAVGRLIETEPRAKELLSAKIDHMIGDLSIIAHCQDQLDLYLPWARRYDLDLVHREAGILQRFADLAEPWGKFQDALTNDNLLGPPGRKSIAQLGNPTGGKFVYPLEKKRTKRNVEMLRQAERNLDHYWSATDRLVRAKVEGFEDTTVYAVIAQQNRALQRTPEWVDPPRSATKQAREPVQDPSVESLYKPLSTIYIGDSPPADDTLKSDVAPKSKVKTKGQAGQTDTATVEPPVPAQDEHDAPNVVTVQVDSRSLKAFRTLFFNPAVTSSPGELSWAEFLHAMTSSGLFGAEKLYGSVWQFTHLEDGSRIQFHEPHPRGKLTFNAARRYGRRLGRNFGYGASNFVLKEK